MRLHPCDPFRAVVWGSLWAQSLAAAPQEQHPIADDTGLATQAVSPSLFASLEPVLRLADIAYCVGMTGLGITPPFSCASKCKGFPTLRLVSTFSTGVLTTDTWRLCCC